LQELINQGEGCFVEFKKQVEKVSTENGVVEAYDGRVEIINPGRLLFDSSKFEKLNVARNPILFDAFHRLVLFLI